MLLLKKYTIIHETQTDKLQDLSSSIHELSNKFILEEREQDKINNKLDYLIKSQNYDSINKHDNN